MLQIDKARLQRLKTLLVRNALQPDFTILGEYEYGLDRAYFILVFLVTCIKKESFDITMILQGFLEIFFFPLLLNIFNQ